MKKAVILNDTSFESHHGCELVINNIIELLYKNNIKTISTNPVGKDWIDNKRFLKSMSMSDIIIVNGEGTLHHSQDRAMVLVKIASYAKSKLKIPVVLINSTYQDNDDSFIKHMMCFDLIFVRESRSKNSLERCCIDSTVVPDISFYTKFSLDEKISKTHIAVTDSVSLDTSKKLYDISILNSYQYLPILTYVKTFTLSEKLKNLARVSIRWVKFFLWKVGFKFNHNTIRVFYYTSDYETYISSISKLKFIFIGRFHALCFSFKTCTPFIAIKSNSHKIEGILEDVGILDRMKDLNDIDPLEIEHYLFFDSEEIKKINKYVEEAHKKIERMFLKIDELLK